MKAQDTDVEGATGHTEVKAELMALGCGPVDNPPPHDLGTDLWVQVLDERLFNRGLVVGAQVKTGTSYFNEPVVEEDGTVSGWVHREDVAHFDDWVRHGLPHFLILRDRADRKSSWLPVSPDAVSVTGKRCKVAVPAVDPLGGDPFDDSFRAAAPVHAATSHASSTWAPATSGSRPSTPTPSPTTSASRPRPTAATAGSTPTAPRPPRVASPPPRAARRAAATST